MLRVWSIWGAPTASIAVELYDHSSDDGSSFDGDHEAVNLAGEAKFASVVGALSQQVRSNVRTRPNTNCFFIIVAIAFLIAPSCF